ncbi:hypothetical protein PENSPDRAFT_652277 [Peniophora sp. CONT]|nr:hypothetical protein PENSPDRAFT_652277 [Peniophora sp. CONT]
MSRSLSQALSYATRAMSSSAAQNKWKGTLPRKIAKDVLTVPGTTPASTDLAERLLEQDREEHHCYFGPVPFHNHLSHHVLAAYDLGAPPALLQQMYDAEADEAYNIYTENMKTKEIEKQDVKLTKDNWVDYLGKHAFYANYLEFFSEQVKQIGPDGAFEEFIYSEEANKNGAYMTERFVAGAIHPLIQMGYALEFKSAAMVPQALAMAAVHMPFYPQLFPWNAPNEHPSAPTHPRPLFEVLAEAYSSGAMDRVMPYDPDKNLGERYRDALTDERVAKIRSLIQLWVPSAGAAQHGLLSENAPDLAAAELVEKTKELCFAATVAFAGTGRHGLKPRLDFFLMHILTSSLFFPPLLGALKLPGSKARLLGSYLGSLFAILLARGSPTFDAGLLMSYSATPAPPKGPTPKHDLPAALGDPTIPEYENAWATMLPHVLPALDSHTLKAFRSLYVYAQLYGGTLASEVRGAKAIPGGDKLDGSAFVRAAGVLLDVMGWVGPGGGEQEGTWDRSALGWDEAWADEKKEQEKGGLTKDSTKKDT